MSDLDEARKRAVIDLSVYNAVSHARRNLTQAEIVLVLRSAWVPAWAPVEEVITIGNIRASVARLVTLHALRLDEELVSITMRRPDGFGPMIVLDRQRTALQMAG